MISLNTIKILIYIGVILAFLAVPIGSYLIVKHSQAKIVQLQNENTNLKVEKKQFEDRIEFDSKMDENKKTIDESLKPKQEAIDENEKKIDDIISASPKVEGESSDVLKNTLKALKESADE